MAELASPAQLDRADGLGDSPAMLGITATQAQRRYQDLQLHTQVRARYGTTAARMFGKAA